MVLTGASYRASQGPLNLGDMSWEEIPQVVEEIEGRVSLIEGSISEIEDGLEPI